MWCVIADVRLLEIIIIYFGDWILDEDILFSCFNTLTIYHDGEECQVTLVS